MATHPSHQSADPPARTTLGERLRSLASQPRAMLQWSRQNPLRSGMIAGAIAILTICGTIGFWLLRLHEASSGISAESALAQLDAGNFHEARQIAAQLQAKDAVPYEDLSVPLYVLGAVAAHEAEEEASERRRRMLYFVASRYLREAREVGLPPQREADGLYLLGASLYHSGQYEESHTVLRDALAAESQNDSVLHELLAGAYLMADRPQTEKALEHIEKFLADPQLPPDRRQTGLLRKSQILMQQGNIAAGRQALEQIPADSPLRSEAIVMQGRLLLREAELLLNDSDAGDKPDLSSYDLFAEAVAAFRLAKRHGTSNDQVAAKADYLLGVCYQRQGDLAKAEQQFSETRQRYLDVPEGLAAGINLADLMRAKQTDDAAAEHYVRVLGQAGRAETYNNPWVSLAELRGRIDSAYSDYRAREKFDLAVKIAAALWPVFPQTQAVLLLAEAHRAWAEGLASDAEQLPGPDAQPMWTKAREQFRLAGREFARLAQLRLATRHYPHDLFLSGDSFFRGRSYNNAVRMLSSYLDSGDASRVPRARVSIGESRLALGQLDQAMRPLLDCIHFDVKDPDVYRARLLASRVLVEKGEVDKAKQLLLDNLQNGELTPQSVEWRDALFALGELDYEQAIKLLAEGRIAGIDGLDPNSASEGVKLWEQSYARFTDAMRQLDEAIKRYPQAPQTINARYLFAEAHRQAAKFPRKKLETERIETLRAAFSRQVADHLTAAHETYTQLIFDLTAKEDRHSLAHDELAILRNCYFARAHVLFDMGRYEDAIEAYSSAANSFHDRPESIEAFVRIAACYRRLDRYAEARGTIQRAKVVLNKLQQEQSDGEFARTTRYKSDQWKRTLDWLGTF